MAFGVKWNRLRASAAGLRGARTNRPRPHPRRARAPSRAPSRPPARVEGRHAAPGVSILLLSTLVRTGRGRKGRARAVSHFPCQSKTHSHTSTRSFTDMDTRSRDTYRAHNGGSRAFALAWPRGDKGRPQADSQWPPREGPLTHAHPLAPSSPPL